MYLTDVFWKIMLEEDEEIQTHIRINHGHNLKNNISMYTVEKRMQPHGISFTVYIRF